MTPTEIQTTVLDHLTDADILRAAADELDGLPLEGNFRDANSWHVTIAGRQFPHRKIIARAAARRLGLTLTPSSFGSDADKQCRWWVEDQMGFQTTNLEPSTQS